MDQPNYYAIIPANVRYDQNLKPNAKLLYGEITALCSTSGFCWAGNEYFAKLYNVDQKTVSRWISDLEKGGFVSVEVLKSEGNKRKLFLSGSLAKVVTKKSRPIDKKNTSVVTKTSQPRDEKITPYIRNNNTSNITIKNTENKEEKALAFFEINSPSDWESFQMRFKKEFSLSEWEKFKELFDCKVDEEGLEFTTKIIGARLTRFAINYTENMKKEVKKINIESSVTLINHPSRKKIS